MLKRIAAAALVVALVACGKQEVDFKDGLPTTDLVSVQAPSHSGNNALAVAQKTHSSAMLGDVAGTYVLTVAATTTVNGATLIALGVLASIVTNPATSETADTAVWGPTTPSLSPITWRLTVTRSQGNHFNYKLEGKPKDGADTAYLTALSGEHIVAVDALGNPRLRFGNGTLNAYWGQNTPSAGSATTTYSRLSDTADGTIDVDFFNAANVKTARYHYDLTAAGNGLFQFTSEPANNADNQTWSVESRWNPDGSGRSDANITGPSLPTPGTLSECWDKDFDSVYLVRSDDANGGWGAPASCAFTAAEFSNL